MVFSVYDNTISDWVDLKQYIAFQGLSGTRNDVDSEDTGRVIEDALLYRERLATKYKWNITTIPLPNNVAAKIEKWMMPVYINIKTDYFEGTLKTYECYANNIQKTYVKNRQTGKELVKLTIPIVER